MNTIKDFRVEKVPNDGESKEEKYKINALHKKIDSNEMAEIPLGAESAGTLKMFALYPELQEVLEKGSVFFIDELNARLHPLLVRNFLLTFLNPNINVNHAQLVFTTHVLGNFKISCCVVMKSGLLRRMIEVFRHYIHLQILWMRMECIFVRTKVMRRIICSVSMVPFRP